MSNLDKDSKIEILNVLNQFKNKKTLIIISHDEDVLKFADKILLLKDKKIYYENPNYFITGGTGSFANHFSKYLVANKLAKKIIIFSRDEYKQSVMKSYDYVKKLKNF